MTLPILEARGLCWGPPRKPDILTDISFSVAEGEVMAICGANGAGKSSLLRMLYRYVAPRKGTVSLMGRDIWLHSARDTARQIAAVLQEQPSDFALTARQIVALGRLPHRTGFATAAIRDAEVISAAITRLDLDRFADHAFGTLSGGEKQRVMVARALAQEPHVLILDEPTNHLDIRHQLELLALLRGLGLTVICTLHDLTLAAQYADRILVLSQGRVLSDGPPDQALSEHHIATAFNVTARVDRSGPAPRFSFHL
ncbi:ABC transporter [Cypionkella aquatica]|uniref:ABC transporter n=1 Tax=Cypionkella aquatica TaxID=1756042 RepID=A0AA37TUZ6_9RHOB|nr:ABC transporter ATP-binding protein [Cypionkella aquatica]GLS86340.1 ABC transporter [Cypionkella aquatica]